jgi:hypothetical protein
MERRSAKTKNRHMPPNRWGKKMKALHLRVVRNNHQRKQ